MAEWLEIKVRVAIDEPDEAAGLVAEIGDVVAHEKAGRWFMTTQLLGPGRGDVVSGLLREVWRKGPTEPHRSERQGFRP